MNLSAAPTDFRIDIEGAAGRAYRALVENWKLAVEMAWLPFIIVFGLELLGVGAGEAITAGHGATSSVLQGLGGLIGFIVFATIFYVRWYRFLLLGERPQRQLFTHSWRALFIVSLEFAALLFVGALILQGVGSAPHAIAKVLASLGGIGLALAALRVSLVFPAAALEQPILFRTAWQLMAGNSWRLAVSALLCFVPFAVVEGVLSQAGSGRLGVLVFVIGAGELAVEFAGLAVLAALLSEVYRGIVGIAREETNRPMG